MNEDGEAKEKKQEAKEWVSKAYQLHMKGDVDRAIALYSKSIELFPTAEAYTFRGWARSFEKDYQAAIEDCHQAIELDPEFGNPYNDIGAYYLEQGEPEDAIPWLRMALKAKRYESYCFPHFNLGRAYEAKDQLEKALAHYRQALDEDPRYANATRGVERVKGKLAARNPERIS